jgi:hypothetical protein
LNREVRDALMALAKTGRAGKVDGDALRNIRALVEFVAKDPEPNAQLILDSLELIGEAAGEQPSARADVARGRFVATG